MNTRLNIVMVSMLSGVAALAFEVNELRCEYRSNPLGIEAAKPRLSWIILEKTGNPEYSCLGDLDGDGGADLIVVEGDDHIRGRAEWRNTHYQIHRNVFFEEGGLLVLDGCSVELVDNYTRQYECRWRDGRPESRNAMLGGTRKASNVSGRRKP